MGGGTVGTVLVTQAREPVFGPTLVVPICEPSTDEAETHGPLAFTACLSGYGTEFQAQRETLSYS